MKNPSAQVSRKFLLLLTSTLARFPWNVVGGRFAIALTTSLLCSQSHAITQSIVPDGTLGSESSVVVPGVEIRGVDSDRIDGGARRGGNLFHSFQEFNVEVNRGAYFSSPEGVDNILTRVTGGNLSNIDGTLGVLGGANLFLINPKGLLFGPGARLDLNGSFFGSTAESILFEEFEFSAANPSAPPLLTVNVPIGLRFGEAAGEIAVRSQPLELTGEEFAELAGGLEVAPGEALSLVGGEIRLEGGRLRAPGGRIELGGLAEAGATGLGDDFSLNLPDDGARANIFLLSSAEIDVTAGGGGTISIYAGNIDILDGSDICAGIGADSACGGLATNFGSPGAQAGDITLDAQEVITISGSISAVNNNVNPGAVGNSGDINIRSTSLFTTDGGQIDVSTFGQGDAGSVNISANNEVLLEGGEENNTFIFNNVLSDAVGSSEGITIITGSLSVINGAQIQSITSGQGNSGGVIIEARDTVSFNGQSDGFPVGIFSNVGAGGRGNSGGIDITTGFLSLANGAQLNSSVFGEGESGKIRVMARDVVSFDGLLSGAFSEVGGLGNSDGIDITTSSLLLTNGARLDSSTFGEGNAGSINISASDEVFLADGENDTFIFNNVLSDAVGDSEGINITTGSLSILNGAQVQSITFGQGNSGSITVEARDTVSFNGQDNGLPGGAFSDVGAEGEGNSGGIEIITDSFLLANGAQLNSSTSGQGSSGEIIVEARDAIFFDGLSSGIFSNIRSEGEGSSGGIDITTNSLSLTNGARLESDTYGQGNAGSISILASSEVFLADGINDTFISNNVLSGSVGNSEGITIATGSLSVLNGSQIQSFTFGEGNSGRVIIDAQDIVSFDGQRNGFPSATFSNVEAGGEGNSGGIDITTGSLSLTNGAQLGSSTFGQGDAGSISISADNEVFLANGENNTFIFNNVLSDAVGDSGGISIAADSLEVSNGAQIQSLTFGEGSSGKVAIEARGIVTFDGEGSNGDPGGAFSSVEDGAIGNAGGIDVTAESLLLIDRTQLNSSTEGRGNAGNISIEARDKVSLQNSIIITEVVEANEEGEGGTGGLGNGGNIRITTGSLSLENGSSLLADTENLGDAGDITIEARDSVTLTGSGPGALNPDTIVSSQISSTVEFDAVGMGGDIDISTDSLLIDDEGFISTEIMSQGVPESSAESNFSAGDIHIVVDSLSIANGSLLNSSTSGQGSAGSISIEAQDRVSLQNSIIITEVTEANEGGEGGVGDGGDIRITTGSLSLENGSSLLADTENLGNAGNITIEARDSVTLTGSGPGSLDPDSTLPSQISSTVEFDAVGMGGDIDISTGSLLIDDGGFVSATTTTQAVTGDVTAGDITITAESIELQSGATVAAETGGSGNAGTVMVEATGSVILGQGTELTVETTAAGQPGAIAITTPTLTIGEDAQLSATVSQDATNLEGGGDITLNTSELNVAGQLGIFAETNSAAPAGDLTIQPEDGNPNLDISFASGGFISTQTTSSGAGGVIDISAPQTLDIRGDGNITASTTAESTGASGSIILNAHTINLQDNAVIAVNSQGTAPGGNIIVEAHDLNLERGAISAETASTDGGNININLENLLVLRDESAITTSAGTEQAGGNGGSIAIDSQFVIAFPSEGPAGNDIFANAFDGDGGSITIDTEGLLGIAFREDLLLPRDSTANDITVSSTFGGLGDFNLVSPEVDPTSALATLSEAAVEVPVQEGCQAAGGSEGGIAFYNIGRGGLPLSSSASLGYGDILGEWTPIAGVGAEAIPEDPSRVAARVARSFQAEIASLDDEPHELKSPIQLIPACRSL